jgi:hypothetical protein
MQLIRLWRNVESKVGRKMDRLPSFVYNLLEHTEYENLIVILSVKSVYFNDVTHIIASYNLF